MNAGSWRIETVEAERFRLDGGSMFGVVPRPLWERRHPADAKNRIQMVTRCLIARGEGRVVIVDTGMGDDWSDREREIYDIDDANGSIAAACAARGIAPDDVTDVVLTHLHFDHAGGAVARGSDGTPRPAFPSARYHVQRRQLAWAAQPTDRDRRSFRAQTFEPLAAAGCLETIDGAAEILPGLHVEPTMGHTPGHQVVRFGEGDGAIVYCGDLIPTAAHLPAAWVMSYDLEPLVSMKEKHALLTRAAAGGWVLVLEHDPAHAAVRVAREGDGFVVAASVGIPDGDPAL